MDIKQVLDFKFPTYEVQLDQKEMMLYGLSIGFNKDPLNVENMKFTYEGADDF